MQRRIMADGRTEGRLEFLEKEVANSQRANQLLQRKIDCLIEALKKTDKNLALFQEETNDTLSHLAEALEETREALVYMPSGPKANEAKKDFEALQNT